MRAWFAFTLTLVLSSGAGAGEPASYSPDTVPAALQPAAARATQAMTQLQPRLLQMLTAALNEGGPAAAIRVCKADAPALAAAAGKEFGVEIGRTSFRLRNPKNAPRPWAQPFVAAAAGRKAGAVPARVVDLGKGRVGVLRPIPMQPLCVACHGPRDRIDPAVRAALAEAYPADEAVGFEDGEVRGFIWAEAR
ncbi:DUF3365 domain-containing protein [Candidatus Binatia bacterium]|nr:DUF3365 domain-containing protein [Candidatus Binatia bacterium]